MNTLKKFALTGLLLLGLTFGISTASPAQVSIGVGIGRPAPVYVAEPPVCPYGYYDVVPYDCAPYGYYGPEYFYDGVFIGVGPWAHWGYNHGWGEHRFNGELRGRHDGYRPSRGAIRSYNRNHGHSR